MVILRATGLWKTVRRGDSELAIVRGIDLAVARGELVSIVGPSGSGKTTLLQMIGGLDRPTAGSVELDGVRLEGQGDAALSRVRRRRLGFVFQFFHLLPTLTAEENVTLPLVLDGRSHGSVAKEARALLDELGIGHRASHRPHQLSGGEMQRVAIARALVADPAVILADEPTGNLDTRTGSAVLAVFRRIVKEREKTLVMVTHDPKAAAVSDRVVTLKDGVIERSLAVKAA